MHPTSLTTMMMANSSRSKVTANDYQQWNDSISDVNLLQNSPNSPLWAGEEGRHRISADEMFQLNSNKARGREDGFLMRCSNSSPHLQKKPLKSILKKASAYTTEDIPAAKGDVANSALTTCGGPRRRKKNIRRAITEDKTLQATPTKWADMSLATARVKDEASLKQRRCVSFSDFQMNRWNDSGSNLKSLTTCRKPNRRSSKTGSSTTGAAVVGSKSLTSLSHLQSRRRPLENDDSSADSSGGSRNAVWGQATGTGRRTTSTTATADTTSRRPSRMMAALNTSPTSSLSPPRKPARRTSNLMMIEQPPILGTSLSPTTDETKVDSSPLRKPCRRSSVEDGAADMITMAKMAAATKKKEPTSVYSLSDTTTADSSSSSRTKKQPPTNIFQSKVDAFLMDTVTAAASSSPKTAAAAFPPSS